METTKKALSYSLKAEIMFRNNPFCLWVHCSFFGNLTKIFVADIYISVELHGKIQHNCIPHGQTSQCPGVPMCATAFPASCGGRKRVHLVPGWAQVIGQSCAGAGWEFWGSRTTESKPLLQGAGDLPALGTSLLHPGQMEKVTGRGCLVHHIWGEVQCCPSNNVKYCHLGFYSISSSCGLCSPGSSVSAWALTLSFPSSATAVSVPGQGPRWSELRPVDWFVGLTLDLTCHHGPFPETTGLCLALATPQDLIWLPNFTSDLPHHLKTASWSPFWTWPPSLALALLEDNGTWHLPGETLSWQLCYQPQFLANCA